MENSITVPGFRGADCLSRRINVYNDLIKAYYLKSIPFEEYGLPGLDVQRFDLYDHTDMNPL